MPFCGFCHKKRVEDEIHYFEVALCEGWDDRKKTPNYVKPKVLICSLDCLIEWAKQVKEVEEE